MNIDDADKIKKLILMLDSMPPEQRVEATLEIMSRIFNVLPIHVIQEIREDILKEFPLDNLVVKDTLELIDGHIALRQIAATND